MNIGHLAVKPTCPNCGADLDGFAHPKDGGEPQPGDGTICGYCTTPLRFTEDMSLRRMTGEELDRARGESGFYFSLAMAIALKKLKEVQ